MEIYSIETELFKLDGGAMFGVVPKVLWEKGLPADENNMCDLAMRLLLVRDGDRLILIDTGIGNKQDDKFFSRYHLHGPDTLEQSLHKRGFKKTDITDVFLTHLHFDHGGGAVSKDPVSGELTLTFPNATYWSNKLHWDWAVHPNAREKASFLSENLLPLSRSGQLRFLPTHTAASDPGDLQEANPADLSGNGDADQTTSRLWSSELFSFSENMCYQVVGGHTRGMMLPYIKIGDRTLVYVTDLIPTMHHFPLPYIASFDVFPLLAMAEKEAFLKKAVEEQYIIYFEHDAVNQCCTVKINEKGKVVPHEIFTLDEFLSHK